MHHTYPLPGPRLWGPALALLLCAVAGRTPAQEPAARGVIVPINGTKTIPLTSKALVSRIQVENPAIVRANPAADAKGLMLTGLVPGRTLVTVTDTEKGTEAFEVVVQSDTEYLRFMLRRAVPTANVDPIPSANNVFILTGTVTRAEDLPILTATAQSVVGAGVVNALRVGGVQQVQLDVVVASVARSELRQMGFSFIDQGNQHFITSVLTAPNTANSTLTTATTAVTSALSSAPNLAFGFVNDKQGFLGFLQALRTESLAKFLADTRLITMSGKPAHFLSGGQLAVPEPSGLGTNAVQFQDFGTELHFLPIVLGNGKIYLEVHPEVKNINAANGTTIQGTTVPGFDVQRLTTTVEMEPGQTFALGGLIQHTVNGSTQKVPVVGDLPFLNIFFSTKSYTEAETELLILVTPHLVDAMACDQLPKFLPGQETRSPDDFELFLEGILEAPRGQRLICPGGHYRAAYLNDPTAGVYPCGIGGCGAGGHGIGGYGAGGCGVGGCGAGGCGAGGCGATVAPAYGAGPAVQVAPAAEVAPAGPVAPRTLPAAPAQQSRIAPEPASVEVIQGTAGEGN
jgi:pilus assembly protein CpaC